MSDNLAPYREDFFLLLEAGFIAMNHADEDSAIKLLKTCEMLDPDNLLTKVGFGYLHLLKLELKQARTHFEEILRADPDNEMATAFLGITLSLTPDEVVEGEIILDKTVETTSDPQIKKVAATAIDFVENYVKRPGKAPGPAEVPQKPKPKRTS
ncbi:MAG: hypothetical protein OXF02_00920 [Simkaniaceae bacterium]|nr:hypothetical protein [Simkaniaceae bacterium]